MNEFISNIQIITQCCMFREDQICNTQQQNAAGMIRRRRNKLRKGTWMILCVFFRKERFNRQLVSAQRQFTGAVIPRKGAKVKK